AVCSSELGGGAGRVGGTGGAVGVVGVGGHREHRQQEPGVVEAGGRAEVGGGVDVDQHRVDAGLGDVEARLGGGGQRAGQREVGPLAALQLVGDGVVPRDRLELVVGAEQRGAQTGGGAHRGGLLEADHHVAHRPVPGVGDVARDGEHPAAVGADHRGGDGVDLHPHERGRVGGVVGGRGGDGDARHGDRD